jgi:glycosidase
MQFTFEGAPCIYYGDEVGMEGGKDPDCRRCYPWHRPEEQNRELFVYYKKLIAIRKANPALRYGSFTPLLVDNERELYVFDRGHNGNECIVALNRSHHSHIVHLPQPVIATNLLTGHEFRGDKLTVSPRHAMILRLNE